MSQIFKILFQTVYIISVLRDVFLVDMLNEKAPFLTKNTSAVKSETYFIREAIEHQNGKVLKENSIIGRSWSSTKLFIMQNYNNNANGDMPLMCKMCDIFNFFELKVRTCSFGKKNKTDQSFSLQKTFLFYDDNVNQLC